MKKVSIALLGFVLLLPLTAGAAYKVYLKNGSVISGVGSYEKSGDDIIIQFGGGSMGIKGKDVLKIEQTGAPEKDFRSTAVPEGREEIPVTAAVASPDKTLRAADLRTELESVTSDLTAVEADEARVNNSISQKKASRPRYTKYQLQQLDQELAPLQEELSAIEQKKSELALRKAQIEGELRALE